MSEYRLPVVGTPRSPVPWQDVPQVVRDRLNRLASRGHTPTALYPPDDPTDHKWTIAYLPKQLTEFVFVDVPPVRSPETGPDQGAG